MKKIDETRNYFIEEINQNEFMSQKYEKVSDYIDHLLILISTVIGYIVISAFPSSVGIPIGFTRSAVGLEICVIITGINNYKSLIKKKEKKPDKIVLIAKSKLSSIEVLFSKALIDSISFNRCMF